MPQKNSLIDILNIILLNQQQNKTLLINDLVVITGIHYEKLFRKIYLLTAASYLKLGQNEEVKITESGKHFLTAREKRLARKKSFWKKRFGEDIYARAGVFIAVLTFCICFLQLCKSRIIQSIAF